MNAVLTEATLSPPKRWTADELEALPGGEHYELVNGELRERNGGAEAGAVAVWVGAALSGWNERSGLGCIFSSGAGYCCPWDRDRVRRPSVSFVRRDRLPGGRIPRGDFHIPPDLAVEVVKPNDLASDVWVKIEEYLAAGVPLVWVVDPESRTLHVYRQDGTVARLRNEDTLTGDDVLPGFACLVADLLPPAVEVLPVEPTAD